MSERGPFERRRQAGTREPRTSLILIGAGVLGLVLLVLVVSPFSILGGGSGNGGPAIGSDGRSGVPDGMEVLSQLFEDLEAPRGTEGPYALTVNLLQPVTDGRNLGLYTFQDGRWQRVSAATLVSNGSAVTGEVNQMPRNIAVLRLTSSAIQLSGFLPRGGQPDQEALSVLSTINPVDYTPAPDGSVLGVATDLAQTGVNILPTVRAATPEEDEAVNGILSSPALREDHITVLVELALQPGNAGVDLDYRRVNPARRADFTAFVSTLAERLHQANRRLTVTLPSPSRASLTWDTGAYDWEQLVQRADMLKLVPEPDPSNYYARTTEALEYLRGRIDLGKVSLVVYRQSFERGSDGLRPITLHEGLSLASEIEVRTASRITPNSSVVIVGRNLFQDDGASGLQWDDQALAVSFVYPGQGGLRTVWLENSLSVAFRLDLARRYGLGGISVSDVSADGALPSFWEPLRVYAESGTVAPARPNGVMLRPTWEVQAGNPQPENRGNLVWTAPAQPGSYDITLIVSDGVIRAAKRIVLEVAAPAP